MGKSHCIVAPKKRKGILLTQEGLNTERNIGISRARVEHLFGRVKRFEILNYSTLSMSLLDYAVRFIFWCEYVTRLRLVGERPLLAVPIGSRLCTNPACGFHKLNDCAQEEMAQKLHGTLTKQELSEYLRNYREFKEHSPPPIPPDE